MFQELLDKALRHVEGAQACILMGFDGIPIASVFREDTPREIVMSMAVEVANLVGRLDRTPATVELGALRELTVRTDRYAALTQVILEEYILVLAVAPETDMARAARMLRLLQPQVEQQM